MHLKLLKQFKNNFFCAPLPFSVVVGVAVASYLVRLSPDQAVLVQALVGDIALCSWSKHLTLTVPDTTQVYKWVRANFIAVVNPAPGVSRDTPSRFMALKQEIRSGLMGHVARLQTMPTYLHIYLNYWKRIVVLIQQSRTTESAGNCCQPPWIP